jgi:predicted dehydrogenase
MSKRQKISCLRFGVVGVGGMGQRYCQILGNMPRVRLTAVCDVNDGAAGEAGRKFNIASFSSHLDMIRARCCDAVAIVTPHPFHCQAAVDCMKAGLHVVTEKPLTERVATADKMISTARDCKVVLAVMFQMRHAPFARQAMEIVRSGRLGRIYRTALFEMKYRSQRYYDSMGWRATWKGEGGGVLINQAPHMMDVFVQLAGVPSAVFGRTETRLHRIEVEDHAEALLKYRNGATGYLYCSTCEPDQGSMLEIFGDRGKLLIRDDKLTFSSFPVPISAHVKKCREVWDAPKAAAVALPVEKLKNKQKYGHRLVLENMVKHLLDGEKLVTPGESGLGSLELANAITLSSHEGKWVKLPIDRGRYDRLLFKLQLESTFVKKNVREERKTDPRHM